MSVAVHIALSAAYMAHSSSHPGGNASAPCNCFLDKPVGTWGAVSLIIFAVAFLIFVFVVIYRDYRNLN